MILSWGVDIECVCPECGGKAIFDKSPFRFIREKGLDTENPPSQHRQGGYYIIEKYPYVYPWVAKDHQHYLSNNNHGVGVLKCGSCGAIQKHTLNWPSDAYYQWDIRGTLLWAANKDHAVFLHDYLQQKTRTGKHHYKSYKLPASITTSKNRELVLKRIGASIEA